MKNEKQIKEEIDKMNGDLQKLSKAPKNQYNLATKVAIENGVKLLEWVLS